MTNQQAESEQKAVPPAEGEAKTWAPIGMLGLLLLVFVFTSLVANNRNVSLGGTVRAIALTSFIALAIERLIELAWLTVGQLKNAWWPFNKLAAEVDSRVTNINQLSEQFFSDAIEASSTLTHGTADAVALQESATKRIKEFQAEAKAALKDVKDNDRVAAASQSLFTSAAKVELLLGRSAPHVALVQQAAVGLADFTASFKDNPAKRMISILFGSTLGMMITLTLGLDAISASLYEGDTKTFASFSVIGLTFDGVGVALTGILLGFGAAPTHEVLKALEQFRKARAASMNPDPQVGTAASILGQIASGAVLNPPKITEAPRGRNIMGPTTKAAIDADRQGNSDATPANGGQPHDGAGSHSKSDVVNLSAGQTLVILERSVMPASQERVTYAKFNR